MPPLGMKTRNILHLCHQASVAATDHPTIRQTRQLLLVFSFFADRAMLSGQLSRVFKREPWHVGQGCTAQDNLKKRSKENQQQKKKLVQKHTC